VVSERSGVHSSSAVSSNGSRTTWNRLRRASQTSRAAYCAALNSMQSLGWIASEPSARSDERSRDSSPRNTPE
jgi:hypothetical protein